jgi:hypothetical protein
MVMKLQLILWIIPTIIGILLGIFWTFVVLPRKIKEDADN